MTEIERGHVEVDTATPTAVVHALTGWALERGIELDELTRDPAVARGRVPELIGAADALVADDVTAARSRRRCACSAVQIRFQLMEFPRIPVAMFFTVVLPL